MYRLRILILSFGVFLLAMPLQALAAEERHEEHKESHYHRHHIGLFLGNIHEEGEDIFSVGLDYEYRFSQYMGIGVLGEYTGKDYREGLSLFLCSYTPIKGSASSSLRG